MKKYKLEILDIFGNEISRTIQADNFRQAVQIGHTIVFDNVCYRRLLGVIEH